LNERDHIRKKLHQLGGWRLDGEQIVKTFQFDRYLDGIRFVRAVAEAAETLNHHPDFHVGYRKVTVTCTTHDASRVTDKDLRLAEEIERLVQHHFMTTANDE
jgi:4a-hydroxytetrahydrobiopterin dehydratase